MDVRLVSTIDDLPHDYRGRILGDEIKFIMQTKGSYSEHIPIEFITKKVPEKAN
jgi:hypothetical protein